MVAEGQGCCGSLAVQVQAAGEGVHLGQAARVAVIQFCRRLALRECGVSRAGPGRFKLLGRDRDSKFTMPGAKRDPAL